jgi:hypothetical protein
MSAGPPDVAGRENHKKENESVKQAPLSLKKHPII